MLYGINIFRMPEQVKFVSAFLSKIKSGHLFCSSWVRVFFTHRTFIAVMWLRCKEFETTKYSTFVLWHLYFVMPLLFCFSQVHPFYFGVEYKNNFCETSYDFLFRWTRLRSNCSSVHETRSKRVCDCFHVRSGKIQAKGLFE